VADGSICSNRYIQRNQRFRAIAGEVSLPLLNGISDAPRSERTVITVPWCYYESFIETPPTVSGRMLADVQLRVSLPRRNSLNPSRCWSSEMQEFSHLDPLLTGFEGAFLRIYQLYDCRVL